MKHKINKYLILSTSLCILTVVALCSCKNNEQTTANNKDEVIFKKEPYQREKNVFNHAVPNHMVLIYEGGKHRNIKWDEEHFAPYVSTSINGEEKWMFDGFLFLEIHNGIDRGFASGYKDNPARKSEWEALLNGYFTKGNAIAALNETIEEVKNRKGDKTFEKRKIVISIPEPIPNQTDWGEVNGKKLNFSKQEDRLEACKWYIDKAEELFKKSNLDCLDLVGYYWLAETATHTRNLVNEVSEYLDKKKYDFYWIPYFHADGYSGWQQLGFNVPYYQPNYFFSEETPYSRLQEACDRAKKHQMNLEVEFDDNALSQHKWGYRLKDYLDVFEKNGVFDSLKVAYYQGGDTFYRLSVSKEPSDIQLYNRLIRIISTSQKKQTDR